MPKGTKLCGSCGQANGPRSLACKACGAKFLMTKGKTDKSQASNQSNASATVKAPKKKGRKVRDIFKEKEELWPTIDWKSLRRGDRIQVRNGPYYMDWQEKKKYDMGYDCVCIVLEIHKEGILAYSAECGGTIFVYMGEIAHDREFSIDKQPHEIKLLTKFEDRDRKSETVDVFKRQKLTKGKRRIKKLT